MKKRCLNCMKEYEEQYEVCPYCGFVEDTLPDEPYYLRPGEILNRRYIVGTAVDNGGFGIIYRAWDAQMEQLVAIKEYFPGGIVNRAPGERKIFVYSGKHKGTFKKGKERYLLEARYAASLSHPNIVSIYDFFEENETAYIVMEYLDGISLKDYMKKKGGRLSCEEMTEIALRVLDALEEIHGHGIIHRDISPDNIFISSGGRVKVIDFGAARFSSTDKDSQYSAIVKQGYAPAEQYQTKSRQGEFTDLYALGACMYHGVTGIKPQESFSRFMKDELEEPISINPEIPPYLNDIILKAMAVEGEARFQSAAEFRDALRSHIAPPVPPSRPHTPQRKKKKPKKKGWFLPVLVAAVLVVVLGVGGYFGITYHTRLHYVGSGEKIFFYVPKSKAEYYENITNKFMLTLDNENKKEIDIEVEAIDDVNYKEEVAKKLEDTDAEMIFFSDEFDESELSMAEDTEEYLAGSLGKDNFYYYESYYDAYPSSKRLPLSFSVPIIVENTKLGDTVKTLNTTDDLTVKKKAKKSIENVYMTKASVASQAKNLASDGELQNQKEDGVKKFQKGKVAYYITDWADYRALLDDSENYMELDILYPETEMEVALSEYISISESENIQAVMDAEQFVKYMAGNQKEYYFEDRDEETLPLNKNAIKIFCDTWPLNLKSSASEADGDKQFTEYLEKCKIQKE